jgi:hypothetical protein
MTREEKAAKIRAYCDRRETVDMCKCDGCPLENFPESGCFEPNQLERTIDRNYEILFGKPEDDPVNRPGHYTSGGIECIDALEASMSPIEYAGFLKGQVFKYIWRYRLKGKPVQDLKKARFYLDRLIQITEKEEVAV